MQEATRTLECDYLVKGTGAVGMSFVDTLLDDSDERRNALCKPEPLPDDESGWLLTQLGNMMNQGMWAAEPALRNWITDCRLDSFTALVRDADLSDPDNVAVIELMSSNTGPAVKNLQRLIAMS